MCLGIMSVGLFLICAALMTELFYLRAEVLQIPKRVMPLVSLNRY